MITSRRAPPAIGSRRRFLATMVLPGLVSATPHARAQKAPHFKYAQLHSFNRLDLRWCPKTLLDGVVWGSDGFLYGTSRMGGGHSSGSLYRMDPQSGFYVILHKFGKDADDGKYPAGRLVEQANSKERLGVTEAGGRHARGMVFAMRPDGFIKPLHEFSQEGDGTAPLGAPVPGPDGWWYGVTAAGGAFNLGTLYRLGPAGEYEILHSFEGATALDGSDPAGPLVQAPDGWLYGVARAGGGGYGSLFRMATDGTYEQLHRFGAGKVGKIPLHALTLAGDGRLYGSTSQGGEHRAGTVFRVGPGGVPELVHAVDPASDGTLITGALTPSPDGYLYYAMAFGTGTKKGTLMRLDPATDETLAVGYVPHDSEGTEVTGTLAISPDGTTLYATMRESDRERTGGWGIVFTWTRTR